MVTRPIDQKPVRCFFGRGSRSRVEICPFDFLAARARVGGKAGSSFCFLTRTTVGGDCACGCVLVLFAVRVDAGKAGAATVDGCASTVLCSAVSVTCFTATVAGAS